MSNFAFEKGYTIWSGWLAKLIGALSLGLALIAEMASFIWRWFYKYPAVVAIVVAYWAMVILIWAQRALIHSLEQLAALGDGIGLTNVGAEFGPDAIEMGYDAIQKMSTYAAAVTNWLSFIDFFVPLHELVLAVTILTGLKLGALIYRFVKSWIPTLS